MAYPQRDDEQRYGEQLRIVQTPEGQVDQPDGRMDKAKPPAPSKHEENPVSLVTPDAVTELRAKWNSIQIKFVDEPRGAVKEADTLVADVIRRITELFSNERSGLEQQWSRGDNVSTEDLRLAMQRYRSFFDRLLSR